MYTGYYAQLKKYLADGLYPVSIAGKCPDWYHGAEYCSPAYYSKLEDAKSFIEHNWDPIEKPERKVVWRSK